MLRAALRVRRAAEPRAALGSSPPPPPATPAPARAPGPPESVRDHIMAATRSLLQGDWAAAYGFVAKLPVWALVPQREAVLGMLKAKLQEEGLRTFLFAYSHNYASLSADQLCAMFSLDEKRVYRRAPRCVRACACAHA